MGTLRPAEIVLDWAATSDDCRRITDAILTQSTDLSTWQRFSEFCDSLPLPNTDPNWDPAEPYPTWNVIMQVWSDSRRPTWTSDLKQAKEDLLKAAFNPNSDLNKFNPNRVLWKSVDKSDLTVYSTELALFPVGGRDVECVGRILDPAGRLLACRVLEAFIAGPSVVRVSTQKEFVCENLGDLDIPGDETNPRRPGFSAGSAPAYLTEGRFIDFDHKTWGHTLNTQTPAALYPAADYASSWMNGNSQGSGLQVYPEPYYNDQTGVSGLWINPADYDGCLQLATVETAKDDFYGTAGSDAVTGAIVKDLKMLATFDDGFDLDKWESTAVGGNLCVTDTSQVTTARLGTGLLQETAPGSGIINTLYPDGAYSEGTRTPAYFDKDNSQGFHGVMSFWIRPMAQWYRSIHAEFGRIWVSGTNVHDTSDSVFNASSSNQIFYIASFVSPQTGEGNVPRLGFESSHQGADSSTSNKQTQAYGCVLWSHVLALHRWTLLTVYWDAFAPSASQAGRFAVDAGPSLPDNYASYADSDWSQAAALSDDDKRYGQVGTWPHLLGLGPLAMRDLYMAGPLVPFGADATFDEFAVYDFGGAVPGARSTTMPTAASPATLNAPDALASARYQQGRYYRGWLYNPGRIASFPSSMTNEAGAYFSGPINLPTGSMLRKVAWTWYRPAALPDDYAEVALVNTDCKGYLLDSDPTLYGLHSRSRQASAWTQDRQDWDVNAAAPSAFRVQVLFSRVTDLGQNTPILESPVFDDLIILYEPAGGLRILTWGDQ